MVEFIQRNVNFVMKVCIRMNGLRLTSCKSAKDRSSMAVTIEAVRILEREHGLKEDVFQQVLDSVRR